MKLPSATFFGWSCVFLQVSEKNWKWQHFVPAQLEISQHKVGDAEGSFTALKRQLQVKMRAERQSRKRFHLWPTQFWPLFRKTLKHTFPAPCYVPLELKHVLKCHLVQTHQRNTFLPPPFSFLPGAHQHSCRDRVQLNTLAITCTWGSPDQTTQKTCFPQFCLMTVQPTQGLMR